MKQSSEQRHTLVSRLLESGRIRGESKVRLFPFRVEQAGDERIVMRSDNGNLVRTSEPGAMSLDLLRRGFTLEMVRQEVGKRHGFPPEDVDLAPLLISLAVSDFIRDIDGIVISTSPSDPLHALRRLSPAAGAALLNFAVRFLPLPAMLRVVYAARHQPDGTTLGTIQNNLFTVFGRERSGEQLAVVARRNYEAVRCFYLDRLLLGTLSPGKLDCWLRDYVRISGLEHLRSARAEGEGVVICAFHLGSYSLIPFVLSRLGFESTVLINARGAEIAAAAERRAAQLRRHGVSCSFTLVNGVLGMRTLAQKLSSGAVVVVMPDAMDTASRKGPTLSFLGQRIRPSRGIAWLAERTRAKILPCIFRREFRYRHCLEIREAIPHSANVTEMLYAMLESEVRIAPEHWDKWKDFHAMIDGPATESVTRL